MFPPSSMTPDSFNPQPHRAVTSRWSPKGFLGDSFCFRFYKYSAGPHGLPSPLFSPPPPPSLGVENPRLVPLYGLQMWSSCVSPPCPPTIFLQAFTPENIFLGTFVFDSLTTLDPPFPLIDPGEIFSVMLAQASPRFVSHRLPLHPLVFNRLEHPLGWVFFS